MGTWGASIFGDDIACDVQAQFRELLGDGVSPQDATRQMIAEWSAGGVIGDPDQDSVFWLALAVTQWKCGRLLDRVKKKAIQAIDSGADLARWEDAFKPGAMARRRAVLVAARRQLLSPQPRPTRIRKTYHDRTDWSVGHLVSYRLNSGRFVVLRVIGIDTDGGDATAIVDMCDWVGKSLPPIRKLVSMPRRRTKRYGAGPRGLVQHDGKFAVYAMSPREFPADRVNVIATKQRVKRSGMVGAMYFGGWRELDAYLVREYGIS